MQKLFLFLVFTWSYSLFAGTVTTKIYDILSPEVEGEKYLLLATDGIVYEVNSSNEELLEMAYQAKEDNTEIVMKLNALSKLKGAFNMRDSVESIEMLSSNKANKLLTNIDNTIPTPLDGYEATSLLDMENASKVFSSMRRDTRRRSQCYNRAHVWTYEIFNKYRFKSRKLWLFFTSRYIREYRYKWWFHVTPAVLVDGSFEDVALDRQFASKPLPLTDWKNIFMHNNADCKEVKYYSDYSENQWDSYCYIIKSSMYYWQPFNIENLEKDGPEKRSWVQSEVDRAYSNAIRGRWFD